MKISISGVKQLFQGMILIIEEIEALEDNKQTSSLPPLSTNETHDVTTAV